MSTYQDLLVKAQECLKQKCPYAHLKDGAELRENDGRISTDNDSVYCRIIKEQEFLYTVDASGNKSGVYVNMKDQKCKHILEMHGCLIKHVWEL